MLRTTLTHSCRAVGARGPSTGVNGRNLHASAAVNKTIKEKVSEVADKVNKSVGKGLASAIDKGEQATQQAKETMESVKGETRTGANKMEGEMKRMGKKVEDETNSMGASVKDKAHKVERDVEQPLGR